MGKWAYTLEAAIEALESNDASITKIDLNDKCIGVEGAHELAKALTGNSTLQWMDLGKNELGDEGCIAIANALRGNTTLKTLYLSHNDICAEGAISIANIVLSEEGSQLEVLSLGGNNVGSEGCQAIAEVLKNESSSLREILLFHNDVGVEGGKAIADAIQMNDRLAKINLNRSGVGDEGCRIIADSLRSSSSLEELRLTNNQISDDGGNALLSAFQSNDSLKIIDLDGNKLSKDVENQILAQAVKNVVRFEDSQRGEKHDENGVKLDVNCEVDEDTPTSSSPFYEKLLEKVTQESEVFLKMEALVQLLSGVHELKMFYTYVSMRHRLGTIKEESRVHYIRKGLETVAQTCTCRESLAIFKVILDKAEHDNVIDSVQKHLLDNDAEVKRMEHAPFIRDIHESIRIHATHIDHLLGSMERLENTVNGLQSQVDAVSESLDGLKRGIRHKIKLEACTCFLGAVLNAFTFGIAGSAVKGALDVTLGAIVDFGDIEHIHSAVESANDVTVAEAFQLGLDIVDTRSDDKLSKAVEKAKEQQNPLITITAVASIMVFEGLEDERMEIESEQPPPPPPPPQQQQQQQQQQRMDSLEASTSSTISREPTPQNNNTEEESSNNNNNTNKPSLPQRVQRLEVELGLEETGGPLNHRVEDCERVFYGEDDWFEGNLLDRIERLERRIFGSI